RAVAGTLREGLEGAAVGRGREAPERGECRTDMRPCTSSDGRQHAALPDAAEADLDVTAGEAVSGEQPGELRIRTEREHDRQRGIAVAQVDAVRLAGDRRMADDVEQVVAHLERKADVLAGRCHGVDEI